MPRCRNLHKLTGPYHHNQGSAMSSRGYWPGVIMEEDVAANGTLQIGQGQDHQVQNGDTRKGY
eukprot:2687590-Prorocentrum_lima.AAC.1